MRLTEQRFSTALCETIAWATPRIDATNPCWCLRSEELRPPKNDWEQGNPGLFNELAYIQHVITVRAQLLANQGLDSSAGTPDGRLLIVDYNDTNHNEATEDESNGFFDWADNPPWDLWVCDYTDKLVCWIPHVFVDVVDRSMLVECMDMLHWVTPENARLGWHPDWMANRTFGG